MSRLHEPRRGPDALGERIRAAGPRPPMPALDMERLSAEVGAVFEARTRGRRRRRMAWLSASIAASVVAALVVLGPWRSGAAIGEVVAHAGEEPVATGTVLREGDRLETSSDPVEWLTVRLVTGHELRLDAGTRLRLVSPTGIDLHEGAVYVVAAQDADLVVDTGVWRCEHIGTRYEVRRREGDGVRIRVRDGRVRLRSGARVVEIQAGEEAVADREGASVGAIPAHGESWRWTLQAAPAFALDGATLASFLEWFAAESGRRVEVDPRLLRDRSGEPLVVHGSLEDPAPERALDSVLESAGLGSRVVDDRVVVERLP